MIHFTNGDSAAEPLRASGVGGRVVIAADVLHEGPCLADLDRAGFREVRAQYLASSGYTTLDEARRRLADCDAGIDAAGDEDEVVLWFEHDLFDQLNLIWLLNGLQQAGVSCERVRLVVIGEHPEIPEFHGLGQLSAAQLAALFPSRTSATADAFAEARRAWAAVCEPTPLALAGIAAPPARRRAGSAAPRPHDATAHNHLPWLPGALWRLLEELPGADGLSRTERQGLEAVAGGARTLGEAFAGSAAREERVFLGDLSFLAAMLRLTRAPRPLLTLDMAHAELGAHLHHARVALTDEGQQVLAGALDHAAVNGLDRWVGGVHLQGTSPRWRWPLEG